MTVQTLDIELTLLADALPGTGVGTEFVNDFVPRDHEGAPVIPASHLKGLLRQALLDLASIRRYPLESFLAGLLGSPGTSEGEIGSDGCESIVFLEDLRDKTPSSTRLVTQTALSEYGTIERGSLRTNESLPVGSTFQGTVQLRAEPDSWQDLAIRLALQSLDAVGGNRNRGAGACHVRIKDEQRSPGQLLRALDAKKDRIELTGRQRNPAQRHTLSNKTAWMELTFVASSPICCPERPTTSGNNVIQSGFVIPASAVQGALLSMIDRVDSGLATACYESDRFRCWPLQPAGLAPEEAEDVFPVRVASSHRMSKLPDPETGQYVFRDSVIEPYDWRTVAKGSPLKGSDGVLLRGSGNTIQLWRHGDMPRVWTAHGVHNGAGIAKERNLYQIEALAPLVFKGLLACPEDVVQKIIAMLDGSFAALGRSRSVRGGGTMSVKLIDTLEDHFNSMDGSPLHNRIFVLQSPACVPDEVDPFGCAESQFRSLIGRPVEHTIRVNGITAPGVMAGAKVLFGWNRHGKGTKADPRHNRLRARRVITPGSVFVLREPVDDLETYLLEGIGDGKQDGLGCLLPHPGIAASRYVRPSHKLPVLRSENQAGQWGLKLHERAPSVSPSQIGHLAALAETESSVQAQIYLESQLRRRSAPIWDRWKSVESELKDLLSQQSVAAAALRVWQDLAIATRNQRNQG